MVAYRAYSDGAGGSRSGRARGSRRSGRAATPAGRARRGGSGPASASNSPEASARTSRGAHSGGVHGASSRKWPSVIAVRTSPGLIDEDGDSAAARAASASVSREAADGGLATRRSRSSVAPRQVRRAARDVDDPPAAALDHPRDERAAAEVDAEDVHLERRATSRRGRAPAARRGPLMPALRRAGRPARPRATASVRPTSRVATSQLERAAADLLRHGLGPPRAERAATATLHAGGASSRAMLAPIPRPPPVTSARPASSCTAASLLA